MTDISLKRIGRNLALVPIVGTAPLIVHQFGAKARGIMLAAQMGETVEREPKNPEQLYLDSMYPLPEGPKGEVRWGFPAVAFKASIVGAARHFKGSKLTMELLKTSIFVQGEGSDMLVPLHAELVDEVGKLIEKPGYSVPSMREDTVRNQTGVADIRFRGSYNPWAAILPVVYISGQMSLSSLVNLVDAAGLGGVGEWRPSSKMSKTGVYGTFYVPEGVEVKEVKL
jgi:hypothetical protein